METCSGFRISCWLLFSVGLLVLAGGVRGARAGDGTLNVADGVTLPYPDSWSLAPPPYANVQELINVPASVQASLSFAEAKASAHILISTELRIDHAEAVSRLKDLATDSTAAPTFLKICGWPALQRRALVPQPQRGESDTARADTAEVLLRLVTAVAVDSLIVRIEGSLMPDSPPAIADQVETIARGLVCTTQGNSSQVDSEINSLRNSWSSQSSQGLIDRVYRFVAKLLTPSPVYAALLPRQLTIRTEMEVAVSSDGKDIVVCGQNTYETSTDGGVTFSARRSMPLTLDGDCSLAVGKSGTFYSANLVNSSGTGVLFNSSTDSGQTFTNLSRADPCPDAKKCSPDQEHIAADRVTAGTGGGDQVYVVWRNFNTSGQDPALVCSQDGVNWTNPPIDVEMGAFHPRLTVGQDGFVYVIYRLSGNIRIAKYSSCANGLAVQAGFPRTVHAVTDVTCPALPGLDRCNDGNRLSSHMAAVDDTNANHIYVAYATNTVSGTNEDVMVMDSTDGGTNWGTPVPINTATTGRRFMPWICPLGGAARVSWYDRRAAVGGATNDLTDYFCGSASPGGGGLTAGTEIKVTDSPDAQCAAGAPPGSGNSWPCTVRDPANSESCSVQPQKAGRCAPGAAPQTPCDLSDCGVCFGSPSKTCVGTATACTTDADCTRSPSCDCTAGQNCTFGGGCPKYGDYNGNACGLGRVYTAWASATAPSGESPPGGITVYFNAKLTGSGPDLSATKSGAPDPVTAGTDLTYTITVTNNSSIPALGVTLSDTVPADTTFQSLTPNSPDWSCLFPLPNVTCTKNFMAANETDTFTFVVHVNSNTPSGTAIGNSATVASNDPDPTPGNNTGSSTNHVVTQADLAVTKNETHSLVLPGALVEYTIVVTNNGPSDAKNATMVDTLPANTQFTSVSAPAGWICTTPPPGGTVTCTVPSFPFGASATFVIAVRVNSNVPNGTKITNAVTVTSSSDLPDPTPDNDLASTMAVAYLPVPTFGVTGLLACVLLLAGVALRSLYRGRSAR